MTATGKIHYFKNLDALRFFAFLAVFVSHAPLVAEHHFLHQYFKLGFLGIDFFFVLSSFLITWIILKEKVLTKNFVWRNFMMRRILRIWPLYFLILLFGISLKLLLPDVHTPEWEWFVAFLANFYIIKFGDDFLFFLTFLWSISVEEQFYLFWSFLMKFISKLLPVVFVGLIISSLVFRYVYSNDSKVLYFHTISILGNFGIGGLTAYIMFFNKKINAFVKSLPKGLIILPYVLLFVSVIFYYDLFSTTTGVVLERLVFSTLFAAIIVEQNFCDNSIIKFGKFAGLNYLGKISYGLYMYHGVVLTVIAFLGYNTFVSYGVNLLISAVALLATIIISGLSFKYFEQPFLKLKQRFYTFDK